MTEPPVPMEVTQWDHIGDPSPSKVSEADRGATVFTEIDNAGRVRTDPPLAGDPFPALSDDELSDLATRAREDHFKLSGHVGHTKQDAHAMIDQTYEWVHTQIDYCLKATLHLLVQPARATVLPHATYPMIAALLAREDIDKPRLHQLVDAAQTMEKPPPPGTPGRDIRADRRPHDTEFSWWNRDELEIALADLRTLALSADNTLEWRAQTRKASVEAAALSALEDTLGITTADETEGSDSDG